MEYLVKTYTNEGETVLDFTMGSGSTGVAAKNLNRNFIGIEMDDSYFEIAQKRIKEAEFKLF
jgi:site-specific DNA-methyltransferase (adenine-specific)